MNHPRRLLALPLLACFLLALSCATSSGSTYSNSVSSDAAAARKSAEAKARAEASRPSSGGSSSGSSSGSGIVILTPPPPPEPMGDVVLLDLPPGSSFYVDGLPRFGNSASLRVGYHEVEVRAFGREPWSVSVYVTQDSRNYLRPILIPAAFSLEPPEPSRASFDPGNPGAVGSARILVRASAPGSLQARILDASGRPVRELGSRAIQDPPRNSSGMAGTTGDGASPTEVM